MGAWDLTYDCKATIFADVVEYYEKASPFFSLIKNEKSLPKTLFIQSKDDPWVPFFAAEKLMKRMNLI